MMTRRMFMGALAAVTAAGGSGLGALLARRRRWPVVGMNTRTVPALLGQTVVLKSDDGASLAAIVVDVKSVRRPGDARTPATEQISLIFRTSDPNPSAGAYHVEGQDTVLEPLYLSPVGPEGQDRRLEAVITRIV